MALTVQEKRPYLSRTSKWRTVYMDGLSKTIVSVVLRCSVDRTVMVINLATVKRNLKNIQSEWRWFRNHSENISENLQYFRKTWFQLRVCKSAGPADSNIWQKRTTDFNKNVSKYTCKHFTDIPYFKEELQIATFISVKKLRKNIWFLIRVDWSTRSNCSLWVVR